MNAFIAAVNYGLFVLLVAGNIVVLHSGWRLHRLFQRSRERIESYEKHLEAYAALVEHLGNHVVADKTQRAVQ